MTFVAVRDQYMPLTAARALFDKFLGRKLMIETGGGHHHAGFDNSAELSKALNAFWPK